MTDLAADHDEFVADHDEFVAVADHDGFVGAFPTIEKARDAVSKYSAPFVFFRCETRATGDAKNDARSVWVLPYENTRAIACVTDSLEYAKSVQKSLLRLNLVTSDEVEYLEAEMGSVIPSAVRRLSHTAAILSAALSPDERAAAQRRDDAAHEAFARMTGNVAREEDHRIDLLDFCVEVPPDGDGKAEETE